MEAVHIQHIIDDGSRANVASVAVTDTEGQYLVMLDNCSYVGKRLAFYVQFMSGDCLSDVAIVITDECEHFIKHLISTLYLTSTLYLRLASTEKMAT